MTATVACKAGCSFCCYGQIHPTAPEVLRIAAYLRETRTTQELSKLINHAAKVDDYLRDKTPRERMRLRIPCIFLGLNNMCQVYDVRPLICRGTNSTDANACAARSNGQPVRITHDACQTISMIRLRDAGLRNSSRSAGLDASLLRLAAALRIALEDPEAGEKWLQGGPVFASARAEI